MFPSHEDASVTAPPPTAEFGMHPIGMATQRWKVG